MAMKRGAMAIVGALVLAPLMLASASAAQQGTPEQRRACRKDAMTFCRKEVPNVQRITACMERNLRKLSPACRAQFR